MKQSLAFLLVALFVAAKAGSAPSPPLPPDVSSEGSIEAGGRQIQYRTVAGMLVTRIEGATAEAEPRAAASMSYVAYLQKDKTSAERPVTFLFNGGPGSSTMWLHMSGLGPMRVLTRDVAYTPPPYRTAKSPFSLLDVTDLVFIDAPGTGFGQVWGRDKYAFFGVDSDAAAFADFISQFLTKFDRWPSPKYLLGQSYGTTRAVVLANLLLSRAVDVNGVMLIAPILNWDLSTKGPQYNPGTDQAFITGLPTYAAVAWYHHRLPGTRPENLQAFLSEVETFARTDYALALQEGAALDAARRNAIAQKMSELTGLPKDYILKSDLRVDSGQFRKVLLDDQGLTVGMCDGRFSGASVDPLSKESDPEVLPDLKAIVSAYNGALNDYVRKTLRFGEGQPYLVSLGTQGAAGVPGWNWDRPQPPAAPTRIFAIANVLTDLASAMKTNPELKVYITGGYFDFCSPYAANLYEIRHLPIPSPLQKNIEYHAYAAGHWPYLHEPSLKATRDNIADFIRRSDNLP